MRGVVRRGGVGMSKRKLGALQKPHLVLEAEKEKKKAHGAV